jgi:HTH-type transcriptional regulator, cell division transcriptional repressor
LKFVFSSIDIYPSGGGRTPLSLLFVPPATAAEWRFNMKIYWHNGAKNIIGKRVREARSKVSPLITQQDLSSRLEVLEYNIDKVSITKIEAGDRFVADYEVVGLAKVLGVSVEWLLMGEK